MKNIKNYKIFFYSVTFLLFNSFLSSQEKTILNKNSQQKSANSANRQAERENLNKLKIKQKEKQTKKVESATQKANRHAEEHFTLWKINNNSPHITASLKLFLNDKSKTDFLIKSIEDKPLSWAVTRNEAAKKINIIISDFKKKFDIKLENKEEQKLREFFNQLITPEIVLFDIKPEQNSTVSNVYANFMQMLSRKITANGDTLADWALRYLSSDSLAVALPIVKKMLNEKGQAYYQLSEQEQDTAISEAAQIISEQFLNYAQAWKDKFKISVPDNLDIIIQQKIVTFLKLKFQPF